MARLKEKDEDELAAQAKRIRELRRQHGVSQQLLADALGIHINTVANWEAGDSENPKTRERATRISLENAVEFSRYVACEISDVLGFDPPADFLMPVTDESIRELFGQVSARLDRIESAIGPRGERSLRAEAAAISATLTDVLADVRALRRQATIEASPDTPETPKRAPRAK